MTISNLFSIFMAVFATVGSIYGILSNIKSSPEHIAKSSKTKYSANIEVLDISCDVKANSIVSFIYFIFSSICLLVSNILIFSNSSINVIIAILIIMGSVVGIFFILRFLKVHIYTKNKREAIRIVLKNRYKYYFELKKIDAIQIERDFTLLKDNGLLVFDETKDSQVLLNLILEYLNLNIPDNLVINE